MREIKLVPPNNETLIVGDMRSLLREQLQDGFISGDTKMSLLEHVDEFVVLSRPVRRAWLAPFNSMLVLSKELEPDVNIDVGISLNSDMTVAQLIQFIDGCFILQLINEETPIGIFHSVSMNLELNILQAKFANVPLGGETAIVSPFTFMQCVEAMGAMA